MVRMSLIPCTSQCVYQQDGVCTLDSAAAAESSADPRIQAGYPKMTDLAPTTATASFSTNKKGIVYWAVTSVTDGSVGADDLINPSSYSPKVVKRGSVSKSPVLPPAVPTICLPSLWTDGRNAAR